MNWKKWIRQFHRWIVVAFTAGFVVRPIAPCARTYTASMPINADELLGLVRELCPVRNQARQL